MKTSNLDYYRLATKSPEGAQWLGDSLYTHAEFTELMAEHERCKWTGTWSTEDGFEYWPVLERGREQAHWGEVERKWWAVEDDVCARIREIKGVTK